MRFMWTLGVLGCTSSGRDGDPLDSGEVVDSVDSENTVDTPVVDTPVVDTPDDTDLFRDSDPGASGIWRHSLRVDGRLDDWFAVEQVGPDGADGSKSYVSWDSAYFYFAISSPLLVAAPENWRLVLIVGNGTGGVHEVPAIGGQSPAVPFGAVRVLHWQLNDLDVLYSLADGVWQPRAQAVGTGGSSAVINRETGVVEFVLSRGSYQVVGRTIDLAWFWVDDTAGAERSFFAVPALGFNDGAFDPDVLSWYSFRADLPDPPSSYSPSEAPR